MTFNVGGTSMWSYIEMGIRSRGLAFSIILVFFCGTLFGSLLPEVGSVLAHHMGIFSHTFNPYFLALGIIGIGVALYLGYRMCS